MTDAAPVRTIPKLTPVDSSNIKAIGYAKAARELFVEFNKGGLYVYLDVPPEEALAFVKAESLGSHLAQRIKPTFRFEKCPSQPVEVRP